MRREVNEQAVAGAVARELESSKVLLRRASVLRVGINVRGKVGKDTQEDSVCASFTAGGFSEEVLEPPDINQTRPATKRPFGFTLVSARGLGRTGVGTLASGGGSTEKATCGPFEPSDAGVVSARLNLADDLRPSGGPSPT